LNSLFKNTKNGDAQIPFDEFIDGVVGIMVDEAHGLKADALLGLMTGPAARIPIRWAITGTIPKEEFEKRSLQVSVGDVIGTVKASDLQEQGVLSNCHIYIKQMVDFQEFKKYPDELKYLLGTQARIEYMAAMIDEIRKTGNTLVLIDRVDPGKELAGVIPGAVFLSGNSKSVDRKDQYDSIATTDNTVTICTYGIAAVGINVPRVFNVVLVEPGKSFVRTIQSIGRGLRKAHDKDEVNIYDFTSTCKFSKRHLSIRKKYYSEAGYPYSIEKISWQ
jgi:superfamily II DNA or RNA helicase